jgi:hypothetical protein
VGDIQDALPGTPDFDFSLRAERDAGEGGRTYTMRFSASDRSGNHSMATASVIVPHDAAGISEPLSVITRELGVGTLIQWSEAPGAISYSVVRGEVGLVHDRGDAYDLGALVCIEPASTDTSTAGREDTRLPDPGRVFFYLVGYDAGLKSGFGTESVAKPREASSGGCQ